MNHLDVGFNAHVPGPVPQGFAVDVLNRYFNVYLPFGVQVAQEMRNNASSSDRFIYTTHPFLVSLFFDCEGANIPGVKGDIIQCPNATNVASFREAIIRGDISWHAGPFNMETDLMDAALLRDSIGITHDLNDMFNQTRAFTLSQRDVPGITRAAIPALLSAGVQAVSVGVNGGSSPPAVPKVFMWRDNDTDAEILAMWHPGGYGGVEISDVVMFPGFEHALAMAFNGDNAGPQNHTQVMQIYAQLRQEFPNAQVFASTWDQFVSNLTTIGEQLPVITDEIGDTWIHGVGSDPLRTAQYRAAVRARTMCLEMGLCDPTAKSFREFTRFLVKIPEHTWGLDVKTFLHDDFHWSNAKFQSVVNCSNFQEMIDSWIEQRAYLYTAVDLLDDTTPLRQWILDAWAQLEPVNVYYSAMTPVDLNDTFTIGDVSLTFNPTTGAINYLTVGKQQWADATHELGLFSYQTMDEGNFTNFLSQYEYCAPQYCPWMPLDFGKPNVSLANPVPQVFYPTVQSAWVNGSTNATTFLLLLDLPNVAWSTYGAPMGIELEVTVLTQPVGDEFPVSFRIQYENKTPTRLPEAAWFSFNPLPPPVSRDAPAPPAWTLQKMGAPVSIANVVTNGSRHMQAVDTGVSYGGDLGAVFIATIDAPLVSIGTLSAFPTPLTSAAGETEGAHFCLNNNIWGTNYIMWYPYLPLDAAPVFRFAMDFDV